MFRDPAHSTSVVLQLAVLNHRSVVIQIHSAAAGTILLDQLIHFGNAFLPAPSAALLKTIAARKVNELTIACYLHGGSYLIKGNSGETIFRVHQDWNNVDETQAMSYALWIPLTDTYGTDGGLCVVPQSHKIFPGAIRSPTNPSLTLDFTDDLTRRLKPLYIKAGQACIYAHNLFHGSRYNTSGALRPVIHAGIFPCEAQQVHYFVNGSTVEEVAVGSEFYYAQLPAMLKGQKPPEFPVSQTFRLTPQHSPSLEDFYREMEQLK